MARFCESVHSTLPVLAQTLASYLDQLRFDEGFPGEADSLVGLAFRLGADVGLDADAVLDAYADFCLTFLREQQEFLESGQYRNTQEGFDKVKEEVYEDDEYMTHYMLGHLLSCAVFPHHYRQYRFFVDRFVPSLPADARVFEFGLGHGLWMSTFLSHSPLRTGEACDISPLCVRLADRMMKLRGVAPERYRLTLGDAVRFDLGGRQYDALVASGLLEHIEDPLGFLSRIRAHLKPGTGRLFTMVPTNTAHPDHLVLFTRVEEIQDLLARAGFTAVEERILDQGNLGPGQQDSPVASLLHLGIYRHSR